MNINLLEQRYSSTPIYRLNMKPFFRRQVDNFIYVFESPLRYVGFYLLICIFTKMSLILGNSDFYRLGRLSCLMAATVFAFYFFKNRSKLDFMPKPTSPEQNFGIMMLITFVASCAYAPVFMIRDICIIVLSLVVLAFSYQKIPAPAERVRQG